MPFDATNLKTETAAHFVALTMKSTNRKVGPIPVSTSSATTCPDACPLKDAGCYAEGGPLAIYWRKVTEQKAGETFARFLEKVAALPAGQLWRHNQSGDLQPAPHDSETIDAPALAALTMANKGKRGFTYTHFNVTENRANRDAVAAANRGGFVINLSGNSPAHADRLAETKAGPVVTVLPIEYARKTHKGDWAETLTEYRARVAPLPKHTPAGRRIGVCPATYTETNCAACQACALADRITVIGFPAHGFRQRKASAVAGGQG